MESNKKLTEKELKGCRRYDTDDVNPELDIGRVLGRVTRVHPWVGSRRVQWNVAADVGVVAMFL